MFQFTPLREGRRADRFYKLRRDAFQFTPLREGRHLRGRAADIKAAFQFTPLREGRPGRPLPLVRAEHVSIHAPA